jgi:hypothetical protein
MNAAAAEDEFPTPAADPGLRSDRGALREALLPLAGVLLGGLLAAGASLFTAGLEAKAQERQAIAQYRRDNREKIYSDMLAQVSVMQNVMTQVQIQSAMASARKPLNTPEVNPEDDPQLFNRLNEQFQPAYDKLSTAISDAELVGSHQVIALSKALQDAYFVDFNNLVVPEKIVVRLGLGNRRLQPPQPQDPSGANAGGQGSDSDNKGGADKEADPGKEDAALKDLPPATLKQMLITAAKEDLAFND